MQRLDEFWGSHSSPSNWSTNDLHEVQLAPVDWGHLSTYWKERVSTGSRRGQGLCLAADVRHPLRSLPDRPDEFTQLSSQWLRLLLRHRVSRAVAVATSGYRALASPYLWCFRRSRPLLTQTVVCALPRHMRPSSVPRIDG